MMEYDLHVHSRFSQDSKNDPQEIVRVAQKMGLNGVGIVDHGSIEGGLLGMQCAGDGFIVVPGMEVNTPLGDILGLFLHSPIESEDPLWVIDAIRRQGGVVVLPHPYFGGFLGKPELLKKFDAIEVCSGRHQFDGDKTLEESMKELEKVAAEHGLTPLGASDAHVYGEIGVASTVIPAETLEDLRAAILKGPTVVKHRGAGKFKRPMYNF
jgi:hypothetical protein